MWLKGVCNGICLGGDILYIHVSPNIIRFPGVMAHDLVQRFPNKGIMNLWVIKPIAQCDKCSQQCNIYVGMHLQWSINLQRLVVQLDLLMLETSCVQII